MQQAVNQKSRAVRFGLEILWPACAVVVGLLATLAWIALLGWGLYRAVLMLGFV